MKSSLTDKQRVVAIKNLEQGKRTVTCHLCGKPTITHHQTGVSICPDCRKAWRAFSARDRRRKWREVNAAPLPNPGEVVHDEEGKVQCHVCGCFFDFIDPHVRQLHGFASLYDYREQFGLNRRQELCSPKVSEKDRLNLVNSGWAGKLLDYNLARFAESRETRLQGRLTQSTIHTGMKYPSSPARLAAAKTNYQKSLIPLNCEMCGAPVMAHKGNKHGFCINCRPRHKQGYGARWRAAHLEEKMEYFKMYQDRKERGEIKPRAPMTMTEAKIRAHLR